MEPLTFLSKMIGVTARVGASFAIGAALIYLLRRMGIEPFTKIDDVSYSIILTAGIIGFSAVLVEIMILFSYGLKWVAKCVQSLWQDYKTKERYKIIALKNLNAIQADIMDALRYIIANEYKRFPAPAPDRNLMLRRMVQFHFLEYNEEDCDEAMSDVYYSVPEYVWSWVKGREPAFHLPIAAHAPWLTPKPNSWMGR